MVNIDVDFQKRLHDLMVLNSKLGNANLQRIDLDDIFSFYSD